VEVAKLAQMRDKRRIPRLYSRPRYWLLSIPLVVLGGFAAVVHGTDHVPLMTALQLGASAPLVFAALASARGSEGAGLMPDVAPPSGWDLLKW
jgi:hypothetical protein